MGKTGGLRMSETKLETIDEVLDKLNTKLEKVDETLIELNTKLEKVDDIHSMLLGIVKAKLKKKNS